ncbi:MAG: methanogenesis marker 12 protein [Methanobacteriota archaeon]
MSENSTLGIDHGTQAVRFCILPERIFFEIDRKKLLKVPVLDEIKKHFPLEKIKLVGLTYSMGDGINKITDIRKVKNRGVQEEKTGEYIGGGTRVFDEIAASRLRAVVIPGLHRGIEILDPRFRALYSHCASAEKVSLSHHCYLEVNKKISVQNLIISDISSNTVTIGIREGKFFGAIDACLGAVGLLHGPLDLEAIRKTDAGKTSANEAFYSSGAAKIYKNPEGILNPKNSKARLALESLILSAKMEISSFLGEIEPEAIVITGSAGVHKNVFARLKKSLEKIAPVFKINGYAAAIGSAEIARDILLGKREFLGIESNL